MDESVVNRLQNYRLDLLTLAEENKKAAKVVEGYLNRHEDDIEHINLIPLSCRYGSAIAVYDMRKMKVTDLLDVKTELRAKAQDEPLPLKLQIPDYSM